MPECKKIKITQSKICSGDMEHQIDIIRRDILPPAIGDIDPRTVFTSLLKPWSAITTVKETRRFDGINTEDRPTHEIFIYYDASIWPLDSDNNFVRLENGRRFRIVGAEDINEQRETIRILCTERGIESLAGSEA